MLSKGKEELSLLLLNISIFFILLLRVNDFFYISFFYKLFCSEVMEGEDTNVKSQSRTLNTLLSNSNIDEGINNHSSEVSFEFSARNHFCNSYDF